MKEITKLVYDTLEKNDGVRIPSAHYPSSASFKYSSGEVIGPDLLNEYLKWTGTTPSNPAGPKGILKMRLGDGTHIVLQKILEKCGVKVLSEVSIKANIPGLKYPISGRVDQLIEIEGKLLALEIKSTTDQQMYGTKFYKGIIDDGPKPDHLLQVLVYLKTFPGVTGGKLLYIARDTGAMIEFDVTLDGPDHLKVNGESVPELNWLGVIERWIELEAALEHKDIPFPEHLAWLNDKGEVMPVKTIKGKQLKTPWRTLYSSYKDLIWKDPKYIPFAFKKEDFGG